MLEYQAIWRIGTLQKMGVDSVTILPPALLVPVNPNPARLRYVQQTIARSNSRMPFQSLGQETASGGYSQQVNCDIV